MIGDTTITLLQRLFTLMNSAAGRHAIYSGAANSLLTLLEADSAAIFEHDEVQDLLVLATARNLSLEAQVQVMQALTRRMQSSPVWVAYPQTVCDWPQQVLDEEGSLAPGLSSLPCLMTMPLRSSKGDLLGVMVAFYHDPAALNGRRQVIASLLAGLVAVSLENAELYEVERQRAEFMAEVLRSGDVLQVDQSLELDHPAGGGDHLQHPGLADRGRGRIRLRGGRTAAGGLGHARPGFQRASGAAGARRAADHDRHSLLAHAEPARQPLVLRGSPRSGRGHPRSLARRSLFWPLQPAQPDQLPQESVAPAGLPGDPADLQGGGPGLDGGRTRRATCTARRWHASRSWRSSRTSSPRR